MDSHPLSIYLFTILFLVVHNQVIGQSHSLKKLRALGRDSLISRAKTEALKEYPGFNFNNFNHIAVMTGDNILYVEFSVPYKYVPLNSAAKYNLTVYLFGSAGLSSSILKNDHESGIGTGFYQPDENYDKVTRFLINTTTHNTEVTSIDEAVYRFNDKVIILEKENYYDVTINSTTVTGGYKVEKETGKIYDQWHKHKMPSGNEFYEIK